MQRLAALCCAVSIAGALLGCSGKVSDVSIAYGGGGAQGGDPGTVNGGNAKIVNARETPGVVELVSIV